MGYCYTREGLLCCDSCGNAGGVRKARCPFGYCPPPALCVECRKTNAHKLTKAAHRGYGCEAGIRKSQERDALRRAYIAKGIPTRCSALSTGDKVHVLFQTGEYGRECVGYTMSHEAYDAIPLLEVATPDDYRKHGTLAPAPPDFYAHTPQ